MAPEASSGGESGTLLQRLWSTAYLGHAGAGAFGGFTVFIARWHRGEYRTRLFKKLACNCLGGAVVARFLTGACTETFMPKYPDAVAFGIGIAWSVIVGAVEKKAENVVKGS